MKTSHTTSSVSLDDVLKLFKSKEEGGLGTFLMFLVGLIFTPVTMAGALWGFVRAYNRHYFLKKPPTLDNTDDLTKASMAIFALVGWILLVAVIWFAAYFYTNFLPTWIMDRIGGIGLILIFVLNFVVMGFFWRWQTKTNNVYVHKGRYGDAAFPDWNELKQYDTHRGLHIGAGFSYEAKGHFLTTAGTTSGKMTCLLAPALLDFTPYSGSWVVIDPKGELTHITSRYQREKGQRVLILDPWQLHSEGSTYNPLDLLKNDEHLADDASLIAEMLIPNDPNSRDKFWDNSARSIVTGLIVHLFLTEKEKTLTHLWEYLRLPKEQWVGLVVQMSESDNAVVRATASEIDKLSLSERTYTSIMSHAIEGTDFLKSPSLQRSLRSSDFDINTLNDGKTTLYIIIPADKIDSHYKWLRLVTSTAMQASVRNMNKRITFILDEFPSLGKMTQVEKGFNYMAGYNVTLWCVIQNLSQLQGIYGDSWENFISNSAVKHYFGIGDNFTAEYLSRALGTKTIMTWEKDTGNNVQTSMRPLADISEVMGISGTNIFLSIDRKPTALIEKIPYYMISELNERADPNPYHNPTGKRDEYINKKMRSMSKEEFIHYMVYEVDKDPDFPAVFGERKNAIVDPKVDEPEQTEGEPYSEEEVYSGEDAYADDDDRYDDEEPFDDEERPDNKDPKS